MIPGSGRDPWRRDRLPTPVFLGFPGDSIGKESACRVGDLGSIPGLGRFPRRRERQYSGLGNSMDCIAQEVAESPTQLSDFHFTATPCHSPITANRTVSCRKASSGLPLLQHYGSCLIFHSISQCDNSRNKVHNK